MGWESINLNEVPQEVSTKQGFEPIPNGTYTLQLLSAEENRFRSGAINISTAVADEGSEYKGRRVFIDIPNPDEQTWAAPVLARIVSSMGATMTPYANPIDELNLMAQNGHSRFTADVYTETFKRKEDAEGTQTGRKSKVNYRSIRPAA